MPYLAIHLDGLYHSCIQSWSLPYHTFIRSAIKVSCTSKVLVAGLWELGTRLYKINTIEATTPCVQIFTRTEIEVKTMRYSQEMKAERWGRLQNCKEEKKLQDRAFYSWSITHWLHTSQFRQNLNYWLVYSQSMIFQFKLCFWFIISNLYFHWHSRVFIYL